MSRCPEGALCLLCISGLSLPVSHHLLCQSALLSSACVSCCPLYPKHLPASSPASACLLCCHFPTSPFLSRFYASFVCSFPAVLRGHLLPTLKSLQALSHQLPYLCVPSFSADSELEKEQWLEAMQGAIAEALSTSEVAERIWAAAPNRFCADCGAAQPDWASINLCIVICKRCAGGYVCSRLAVGLLGRSCSPYI